MKLLLFVCSSLFLYNLGYSQLHNPTGEQEWDEENEKEIIREEFSATQYPNLPERSKDLKYLMPPAGKQGTQGSCWAWATTYAMRSAMDNTGDPKYFLDANGRLDSNKVYSPSYTYQYYKGNKNDCNFGNFSARILDSVLKNGAIPFRRVGYNETKCNFGIDADTHKSAKKNAKSEFDVFYLRDLHSAKKVLADGQPLIISMRLGDGFYKIRDIKDTGQNIIWKRFGTRTGDHAMVCVAYDDTLNAVKVLNSWGADWGMQGYCWIDYDIIEQSRNYFCYPKKAEEKRVTRKDEVIEKKIETSGSSWPVLGMLSAWFKENYYVRFEKYKFVLADLNKGERNAVVEIRDSAYNFIKNFTVDVKSTAYFYIDDQQYKFTLDDIAHRGRNFLKKAAVFRLQRVRSERE